MQDPQTVQARSKSGQISKSAVGRVSGVLSRVFLSASALQGTGRFLRRQLWAWPIIAAMLVGGPGWWVHRSVENAMRAQRVAELNVIVDASVSALHVWMGEQRINAQLFAADEQLRPLVTELLTIAAGAKKAERDLIQAKSQELLRQRLKGRLALCGYVGYFIVSPDGIVLAADQDAPIGNVLAGYRKQIFDRALAEVSMVSRPFRSPLLLADENGEIRANLPTMFAVAVLRDDAGKPIASLGLRIRPEDQFTRILQVVRFGESGETYAFDKNGLMLSQSRFDDDLKQFGLLADQPDVRSILTLEVRDPQVDMSRGERPTLRRGDQPLTRMSADAVQGKAGHDADGYRDYRGVPNVGAWRWLDEYDFGVATEVDVAEAFRPVYILRRAFRVMMALLVASAIGIFLAMLYISRQQRALQKATLAAKQLGQYTLAEKLGTGGMGTVYKARHAMLRRPTAVKLLNGDKISDAAVTRFEREVQLTSALTHPNTVAVFDFGRTPDGILYYVMEYLEGLNLDDLVKRHGPLPAARMVFLLKQVCGALSEAHASGLVPRDIKPANSFLTRRGGLYDFVKVLDFGLVKALAGVENANLTNPNAIAGTPLYMSPEAISQPDQVDAGTDVYAVAAVGYYLLTGAPVFTGDSIMEICMKHTKAAPEPPSARSGIPVPAELEALLLRCLAKAPADRPKDAAELLRALEACAGIPAWTFDDAAAWWAEHEQADRSTEKTLLLNVASEPNGAMPVADITMAYPADRNADTR